MTEQEWLDVVRAHKPKLIRLLEQWHPINLNRMQRYLDKLQITAPSAEQACEIIREKIKQEIKFNPVAQFNDALEKNDWRTINSLLNDAWFGVPESTSCWNITGFKEAIELLEEPPDNGDDNEEE